MSNKKMWISALDKYRLIVYSYITSSTTIVQNQHTRVIGYLVKRVKSVEPDFLALMPALLIRAKNMPSKLKIECNKCGNEISPSVVAAAMGRLNKPGSQEMRRRVMLRWEKAKKKKIINNILCTTKQN